VEVRLSSAKLQTATQQELIDRLNQEAAEIKTLNATVDIDSSVGGEKRGKVTDFKEIRGYVLVRKPNMLRMIGLYPIVRNKAFDIVSNGQEFKLSVPATNKFYIGHNQVIEDSSSPLDTLRPQAIYDALLLQAVNPDNEIAVLESSTEMVVDAQTHKLVQQPNYVLDVVRRTDKGWTLARKVDFDRTNLIPHRQVIYDDRGNPVTDARYQAFKEYDSVKFPTYIDVKRPQEEYDIRLFIVKLTVNQAISEDQFTLEPPPGSLLVNLDDRNKNVPAKDATTPGASTAAAPVSNSDPPRL
jgi:outer membrane lipoprotein-sorting protein